MKNGRQMIALIVVGVLVLAGYLHFRKDAMGKVEKELADIRAERVELEGAQQELANLKRLYPVMIDFPGFVEQLHRYASQTGIAADYELTTIGKDQGRTMVKGQAGGKASRLSPGLGMTRMKISLNGPYRDIAEYLKLLQQVNAPSRITSMKMVNEQEIVKMSMDLELYSYRENNGAR